MYRKNVSLLRIVRSGPILSTRAGNAEVNRPMWPDFQRIRDFMAILVTCKFDDDLIKHEVHNIFSIISLRENLSALKSKLLQSEESDLARNRTRPRFYACPGCL